MSTQLDQGFDVCNQGRNIELCKADVGYPNDADNDPEDEPLKAAYSDAFKRAAVQFGIGRWLYQG